MRAKLALIPIALGLALLGACATKDGTSTNSPAPTTPASNGVASLEADAIMEKASAALKDKKTFRVKGSIPNESELAKVNIGFNGEDASGTFEVKGVSAEIIKVGDAVYLKATDAYWSTVINQPAMLALLKGKYVKVGGGSDPTFGSVSSADEAMGIKGTATKGETKTINGVPAIGIIDGKDQSVVYIATQGDPVPLQVDDGKGNTADFTYVAVSDIKAPDAANVVDIGTLIAGMGS